VFKNICNDGSQSSKIIKNLLIWGIIEKESDSYQVGVMCKRYRLSKEYLTDYIDYLFIKDCYYKNHEKFFNRIKKIRIDHILEQDDIIKQEMINLSNIQLDYNHEITHKTINSDKHYTYAIECLNNYDFFTINTKTGRTATNTINFNDEKLGNIKLKESNEKLFTLDIKCCLFNMMSEYTMDEELTDYLINNDIYTDYGILNGLSRDCNKLILLKALFGVNVDENLIQLFESIGSINAVDWLRRMSGGSVYKKKAFILQEEESKRFNSIKKTLCQLNIFYLSKYDSVIVKESDVDKVKSIMENYFNPEIIKLKKLN
jgi:hypothetical protein